MNSQQSLKLATQEPSEQRFFTQTALVFLTIGNDPWLRLGLFLKSRQIALLAISMLHVT